MGVRREGAALTRICDMSLTGSQRGENEAADPYRALAR